MDVSSPNTFRHACRSPHEPSSSSIMFLALFSFCFVLLPAQSVKYIRKWHCIHLSGYIQQVVAKTAISASTCIVSVLWVPIPPRGALLMVSSFIITTKWSSAHLVVAKQMCIITLPLPGSIAHKRTKAKQTVYSLTAMKTLVLISVVLLVYCTVVCAGQENDQPLTTSELRRELNRAMHAMVVTVFEMFIPGYTPSHPTSSCEEILQLAPQSPSALYWISGTDNGPSQMYCDFTPGYTATHPASSCKEILQLAPQSPSGLYWLNGTDNKPKHMYCDMERSCKGVAGGWMRMASIDMTDTNSTCLSGLRTLTSPRRLCAVNIDGGGCSSPVLPVKGIEYSQVCGKIIGYQQRSPDAFKRINPPPLISENIDSNYVDGISLTHGTGPRQHIWTFAAALHEYNSHAGDVCPCTNTRNIPSPSVPGFIGNDYFCDTGSQNLFQNIFYGDDPLWDGAGCGQYSTCCYWNSPPWFRKEISPPTSDDIEMRLCTDQNSDDEDINFEVLELYVQ